MDGSSAPDAAAAAAAAFDFKLYRYTPSLPAAIVSVAVFAALTALHTWRIFRARALYFTAFTIGGLFQTIGYCGRIWSHFDTLSIGGFVIQAILILVAPALYAASIYMILGRLIRTVKAEHLSLIPVNWVTRIFVAGDVVAFTLQAGGGGVQAAGTLDLYEAGEKIIIAGLFVQIVVFGFFVVTSLLFHVRLSRNPTTTALEGGTPWRRYLYVLYATSAIILIRSVFRVVEYLQGNKGYLISHEIFLYIFDTLLMAIVMAIFLICEALLAWSLLNIIYVFSISKQLPDQDKRTAARLRRDRVLGMEWIPMARGINAVLVPTYQYLKDGPMSSLITLGNWNELDPGDSLPEPVDAQLCRLKETWANNNDAKTYDEALHILRKCRMYVLQFKSMNPQTLAQWGFNRDWAGPLTFIHFVPQEYVSLLHQRQPPALVLFAYFGAFMHALDDYWFFEGWGKDIVEVVDDLLGSYWRSWITWPIEYVGLS
ncbi:Protein RTA1 [Colletotrichum siamense]|nr:Protein RTA1 [Colletotrichum siamense]